MMVLVYMEKTNLISWQLRVNFRVYANGNQIPVLPPLPSQAAYSILVKAHRDILAPPPYHSNAHATCLHLQSGVAASSVGCKYLEVSPFQTIPHLHICGK